MLKRIAAVCAALFLLSACSGQSAASSASVPSTPFEPVLSDGAFKFEELADSVFTMEYDPVDKAVTKAYFGLNMPDGIDTDWTGHDTETESSYTIYDAESKKVFGTVKITTAPPDPTAYYGTSDPEEIKNQMLSTFFVTDDVYAGLKKAIVEDFGYDLSVDQTGTAYDWPAFYLEFVDTDSKNHALRYYMCNGEFNEKFYALSINVDLPMNDQALIEKYRSIIFSLHRMEDDCPTCQIPTVN